MQVARQNPPKVVCTVEIVREAPLPNISYDLNSSLKAALIKSDILDNKAGKISFQDPIYAYWLKTEYFAISGTMGRMAGAHE